MVRVHAYPTAKVSEGTNRNIGLCLLEHAGTTLYNNPESHNAQVTVSQTQRQTDGRRDDANSRSTCVAVSTTIG